MLRLSKKITVQEIFENKKFKYADYSAIIVNELFYT